MGIPVTQAASQRYVLLDVLGQGGMGTVYRAEDRLAGGHVALKQLTVPGHLVARETGEAGSDLALALAREFKALATLSHPNVIRVFDFGFNEHRQPFFTMEYVDDAQNVLEAGRVRSFQGKVNLIIQMLQALVYLHRRGILHRDIKPENVLVQGARVRLVDFGLSVITERTVEHHTSHTAGTMAYMAPEIFRGRPYSPASDLYSAGLIAFELLTGTFPYSRNNVAVMLNDILNREVLVSEYVHDRAAASVLERLLAKNRQNRYSSAKQVIEDLSSATGIEVDSDAGDIRESFLVSARFVGRLAELDQLVSMLNAADQGRGRTILVGGQSGVGKSRLMDELRTHALVKGFLVLEGQTVAEGRVPYQLWRNVLQSLALYGLPDDGEAAVIKPLVPNIDFLVRRAVPDPGEVEPQAAARRLRDAVVKVLTKVDRPLLLILEDLHWAGAESIELLTRVSDFAHSGRILLAGTYRDDRPTPLIDKLLPVDHLRLSPFKLDVIAELSQSMLGPAGGAEGLVGFLFKETEGNAFFLVEAVRALAEETGSLDEIERTGLPDKVTSRGIQRLLRRRLERLPAQVVPLLRLAAVAGRRLDLGLLGAFDRDVDLEAWLSSCAAYAVLEPDGSDWRFAHDKLRDEILSAIPTATVLRLHWQVAETIEAFYPDLSGRASELAYHWSVAGDRNREYHWSIVAGHEALASSAYDQAIQYFERSIELLLSEPESQERDEQELSLRTALGAALIVVRGYAASEMVEEYSRAQELATKTGQAEMLFRSIWGQWQHYVHEVDFDTAISLDRQLTLLAQNSQDEGLLLEAHHARWSTEYALGDAAAMRHHTSLGLTLYDPEKHADHKYHYFHDPGVCAHFSGALSLWMLGYPDQAREHVIAGLSLAEKINHPYSTCHIMWARAIIAVLRGEYEQALAWLEKLSDLAQSIGFTLIANIADYMNVRCRAELKRDTSLNALLFEGAGQALRDKGFNLRLWYLSDLIGFCLDRDLMNEALEIANADLDEFSLDGRRLFVSEWRRMIGELLLATSESRAGEAESEFKAAVEIAEKQSARSLVLRAAMSLARLWQSQGKTLEAHQLVSDQYHLFDEGFETADLRQAKSLISSFR